MIYHFNFVFVSFLFLVNRFVEMTIRRHIQEEESPRFQELTNYTGIQNGGPMLSSLTSTDLNLRDRKRRKKHNKNVRFVLLKYYLK